jgi:hypothetical protein
MSRVPEFTECVAVTAYATRAADLDEAAKRLAASAFEGYKDHDKGWVSAHGSVLHASRRGYAEPHAMSQMGARVDTWRADYLVGTVEERF